MRNFVLLGSVAGKWISSKGEFQANDLSESCHTRNDIFCDGLKCGEWDCASLEHNGESGIFFRDEQPVNKEKLN